MKSGVGYNSVRDVTMSGLAERKESRSPSTISDSSLSSSENDQASDDEELQRLLEQRSSSPSMKFSEEKLLNEFRTLYSESLNVSSLEQSGLQEATEDEKKVRHWRPRVVLDVGANLIITTSVNLVVLMCQSLG